MVEQHWLHFLFAGVKMQHLLEVLQTLSSLPCLKILILLENILNLPPFKPPRTLEDDIPSEEELSTPPTTKGNNAYVNIDSSDEAPRTEKQIFWSQEEDVRMVSLIAICWCLKFLLTILAWR